MVRWYHAIFTAYGFWLPNDPRGSWSEFVASFDLYRAAGKATTTDVRRSVAGAAHDASARRAAKSALKFDPVRFNASQRGCTRTGIRQAAVESGYAVHALAIGYDHVHEIVGRHEKPVEEVVRHMKSRATQHLTRGGCHPFAEAKHSPWAEKGWNVYLDDDRQLRDAIAYVNRHPEKEGLPPQNHDFIAPV